MTNHEQTLVERNKAKENFPKVLEQRRLRRKERNKKVVWLEGSKKLAERPEMVLYYPWIERSWPDLKEEKVDTRKHYCLGFEKMAIPEVKEFVSRI